MQKKPIPIKAPGNVRRLLNAFLMLSAIAWRLLRLPIKCFRSGSVVRNIHENWTTEMMVAYATSFGRKLPHDQICPPIQVDDYKPLADVDSQYRLSEQEIEDFYQNGFLEPFDVLPADEMEAFCQRLLDRRSEVNETYDVVCDRDRHFEMPEMMRIMAHPAITERLAQLLGPNVFTWRSQIFHLSLIHI